MGADDAEGRGVTDFASTGRSSLDEAGVEAGRLAEAAGAGVDRFVPWACAGKVRATKVAVRSRNFFMTRSVLQVV